MSIIFNNMSLQLPSKVSKKRSFSQLSKKGLDINTLHFKSRVSFPTLPPSQLIQALSHRQDRNYELPRQRPSFFRESMDLKGQNQGLRRSIKQSMDKVKLQKKQSNLTKDQLFTISQDKNKLQKDYRIVNYQYQDLLQKHQAASKNAEKSQLQKQETFQLFREIVQKLTQKLKKAQQQLKKLKQQNKRLQIIASDQGLAGERIKVLEIQLRQIKLDKNSYQQTIGRLNKEIKEYQLAVRSTKPQYEKQEERIRYYERLVGDLQKKSQQFCKKEHEYNKEIQTLKKEVHKILSSKDSYKKSFQQLKQKLNKTSVELENTKNKFQISQKQLSEAVLKYQSSVKNTQQLSIKIDEFNDILILKSQQNSKQKMRIDFLENHQHSLQIAIQQAEIVSQESNLFVQKRDLQVYKLKQEKQFLQKKIEQIAQRFKKFDEFYMQNSGTSKNKLKESIVTYVRTCSKIQVDMHQLRKCLDAKQLQFMEERQILKNALKLQQQRLPTDPSLHQQVFKQKNDLIRILQNSNSQLLKSSVGFQDVVGTLEQQNKRYQKQIKQFQKTIQEFDCIKRENIDLKNKERECQLRANEHKKLYNELQDRLKRKSDQFNEANNKILELQQQRQEYLTNIQMLNIKLGVKIPLQQVAQEKQSKIIQEQGEEMPFELKEAALRDALQKMSNALKSIQLYFSCGYCEKLVQQPYSVIPCGHHFCHSCRQGFRSECYQCSNNMSIQGSFRNSNLQSAIPRLRFLSLVFDNVSKVFAKSKAETQQK